MRVIEFCLDSLSAIGKYLEVRWFLNPIRLLIVDLYLRIVVAFNIERFVYVVCPFRASRMCTERASRMAIGIR